MSGLNNQKYHYVYRITNKVENKHYYGVRTSKVIPKDDLGRKYFSSSTDKEFIKEQKEHPERFKYKVIREFETRRDAELLENKLHKKFHVSDNDKFYNKCISTLMGFSVEGTKWSEEHRKNIQKYIDNNVKGKTLEERFGEERAKEIRMKNKGRVKTEEWKRNISKAHQGKPLSKEHREAISKGGYLRYANESPEKREMFRQKMDSINKSEEKRREDSEKLKQLWSNPETRERIWGNREPKPSFVIKITDTEGNISFFKGIEKMCEEKNFSPYIVRKALKTKEIIKPYKTRSTKNSYTNIEGFKFEIVGKEQ